MPVTNKTRLELIFERTYIKIQEISICKVCNRVFLNSLDCIDHQEQEHTDKQFEDRF